MVDETPPQSLEEADAALLEGASDVEVAPEPSVAEPAAETEQPRDEQGRFTSPVEPAKADAAPADQAEAAQPSGEPTEAAVADEAVAEDYPVASYRADGQDFEIPGSAVGEDGTFIPADIWTTEVLPLISAGKQAYGSIRQRISEAASREQQANDRAAAAEAQAQKVLATFEDLVEKSQHAQTIEDLANSPLGQWLLGVRQNWPILKAQAEAKAVEFKNQQATKELERYREQEQQARLRPLMEQTLEQSVMSQGQQAGLDEATLSAVLQTLRQPGYQQYLFVKAPYDDPGAGIRKGELVIDHGVVASALQLASVNRAAPVQQQKIAQAQAENAKAAAPPKKVPPTVGGKGRAPQAGTGIPAFKSAKEADDWFERGGYNDLEVAEG